MRPPACDLIVGCAAVLLAASMARGLTPAVLVGPDLVAERISINSLRDGLLSYFDARRDLRRQPLAQFVQLRAIGAGGEALRGSSGQPLIDLVDGRRLVGSWSGASPDGEAILWRHRALGQLTVPLEEVRAVTLSGEPPLPGADSTVDMVTLANGDQIRGHLSVVEERALDFVAEGGGEPISVPLDRVASLVLNNPRGAVGAWGQPPRGQNVVWLADGSRLFVTRIEIDGERVNLEVSLLDQAPRRVAMSIDQIERIDFTASGWWLVDLVDLPFQVLDGGEVFYLPMPPRVEGRTLWMHAPVRVVYALPDSVVQFSATAELAVDDQVPTKQLDWADFELIVRGGGSESEAEGESGGGQWRHRIHAGQRRVEVNVPVAASSLTIELDPGVNGPILDRLRLRDAVLLIRLPHRSGASDALQP